MFCLSIMPMKCLIIADDLTGGADAGAQFAKIGFNTILISYRNRKLLTDLTHSQNDVVVINTNSREISSTRASKIISRIFSYFKDGLCPVVYKKIDSTLRGNIGFEIDAILNATNLKIGFLAPSFPEQERIIAGGILLVRGTPLSLTEVSLDKSPVKESYVHKVIRKQSGRKVGRIDLVSVAAGPNKILKVIESKRKINSEIIIFDAVLRKDLKNIAEAAYLMNKLPLFIGSAGLAQEIARKILKPLESNQVVSYEPLKEYKHVFLICGSLSHIAHKQIEYIKNNQKVKIYELTTSLLEKHGEDLQEELETISLNIANSLKIGHVILKTTTTRIVGANKISKIRSLLGKICYYSLKNAQVNQKKFALAITGGATVNSIFNFLRVGSFKIQGELLEGVVFGKLLRGYADNLTVITKAGSFGEVDIWEKVFNMLRD